MVVHATASVVSTWPLAARLTDGIPQGREPVATVPWFNLWSLQWTADTLPHSVSRWWNAPIFHPLPGAYARSELQPLTGLVYGAFRWMVSAPVAYGLVVLLALLLDGLMANRLARRLGAGTVAACLVGVLAQTVPFLFEQLGVVQLLMIWPVLLALDCLLAWADRPSLGAAAGSGAALALGTLTCSYHSALFALAALVCSPLLVRRTWLGEWRRRLAGVALAAAVFAVLALPFAVGQARRLGDTRWTDGTIRAGSASWADLVPFGHHFVGLAVAALAAGGVVVARRERRTWFLLALAVTASVVAMGSTLSLFGWRPYEVLVHHLDVIARMRSPFRAVVLTQVVLVVLSAPFVQWLWARRGTTGRVVLAGAMVAAVAPLDLGSGPIAPLPPDDLVWADWLRDHPGGAVAMMPMPTERPVEVFEPTAAWMLQALDHGHPLLNGYTGFFPTGDRQMRERMAAFPDAATVEELAERDVCYVVADSFWWTSKRDATARDLGLEIVLAGPDGVLIDLRNSCTSGN